MDLTLDLEMWEIHAIGMVLKDARFWARDWEDYIAILDEELGIYENDKPANLAEIR